MKNVLITGAGRGIGRACVELFAQHKWQVFALDKIEPEGKLPDSAEFVQVDLSSEDEIRKSVQALINRGLSFSSLVNNAAIQPIGPMADLPSSDWDNTLAVNLKAPYILAQALLPAFAKKSAIVNIVSVHALATSPDISAYAASKGGLLALTRSMAVEFASRGIRVNAVLPGATDTAMLKEGLKRDQSGPASSQKQLEERILLGRLGKPEEIALAVHFLVDEEQSSYITGQSLVVDGGAMARLSTE